MEGGREGQEQEEQSHGERERETGYAEFASTEDVSSFLCYNCEMNSWIPDELAFLGVLELPSDFNMNE